MKQINREWNLSEPQFDFFTDSSKFKAFLSARGAGKTSVGWMNCLRFSAEFPGSRGVIVAPSFPLIDDVILPEMDDWIPKEFILKDNRFKHNLFFDNGSVIMFRSADNMRHIQRLRGLSISWFWIDEATLTPQILWDVLLGGLRQKGFKRQAWITGTPKPNSWVKKLFMDKLTRIPNCFALTDVPIESNRHLPSDYVSSLRSQYSGRFAAQELDGLFVEFEGLVYPDFSHRHILSPDSPFLKPPFQRMIYAIDWGFRNPCCLLAIGFKDKNPIVIQEFYRTHVIDDKLIDIAKSWRDQFGPGPIYCDPSQPDSIAKFRIAGLDAHAAKNPVVPGIKTVTSFLLSLDKQLYVSPFCQNLISEFYSYCYSESSDMPIKVNDHALDSLRYGLHSFQPIMPFYHSILRKPDQ
jgi:PBSX family phage terminase large subunit